MWRLQGARLCCGCNILFRNVPASKSCMVCAHGSVLDARVTSWRSLLYARSKERTTGLRHLKFTLTTLHHNKLIPTSPVLPKPNYFISNSSVALTHQIQRIGYSRTRFLNPRFHPLLSKVRWKSRVTRHYLYLPPVPDLLAPFQN